MRNFDNIFQLQLEKDKTNLKQFFYVLAGNDGDSGGGN